jgi:glycosyltransferase involved in cell wall biosynthesis
VSSAPTARLPRVLVLHNRYRFEGGEERAVELQLRALRRAGIEHASLQRSSAGGGRPRAAAALLRGGEDPAAVADAAGELHADVVHAHNMHPFLGPRALSAAKDAGARVVLHLHNVRLFCAIGVAFRDGAPCFRCRGRRTLPGLVLNCRGSVPEAAVYAVALSLHQPDLLSTVDRFVAPSSHAVGQLVELGLPADRMERLGHYLPEEAFARRSGAGEGSFGVIAARLVPEKGIETAIEAAAISGVPLKVAGEGPLGPVLRRRIAELGAPVELLGRVGGEDMRELRSRAALAVVPSLYHEFSPFAAAEAMAAGLPVVASRRGGLPEVVGEQHCVPPGDATALATALEPLWREHERRQGEGEAMLARARERFAEDRFVRDLLEIYRRAGVPADPDARPARAVRS